MTDDDPTRTEDEGATVDLPGGVGGIAPGQVLGERYQVLELLGRGGMGEVWHAFDLKLRVEVALKALREDLFKSERRLEMLRDEVRAAREVVSPNVCRIFDLIEIDSRELVSMEYVDGATLLDVLFERGPLELKEAQDIASQFLAGLEAIHKAGLIHRDIKPENIMLTRAGRVVVMDFGLARQEAEGGGTVSGTPAYMAPEQAAGQTLDARADVYAAGVVLAEMVSPDGIKNIQSRQSVWEGVRTEPAKVPDTPWAEVIKKAVKKDREQRFNSAHTLTRALEDVTLRVEGAEDLHPYPGLASFTEADAEYFFGREAEVEQMWRKLEGPPRMLAIIGPSGAGKSSFIAAGLGANSPPGWGIIRSTPGKAAIHSLARVVARETAGDPDVVELLPRFESPDVSVRILDAWARKSTHALLVVDQFEELLTQNSPEEQRRFADLLRRFVLEADVHVLLSMRDDFAAACNAHEALHPIFQDLTVLDPPSGASLRRAIVQPAQTCGYRFEDDELVEEMLAELEDERGALPLLAFAAARLWEKRDRETGLLTRQAYHDIGGVGGALARHAEATVDQIGHERLHIVRELFRNLVTAEGTRAVREWDELLSVFCDSSDESQAVLRSLIDARLLTSYEVREDDREPTRRVEIIHESLLANWPRLVRWQTQDQEGAQLRDELRQSAKAWDEHGRQDDRLWTGTAFREYALWRERYPGGLSQLEEAFAAAMTSLATRRRRRRRVAAVAALATALAVAAVFGALWRRSVHETRRAEAAKLLALARVELETGPTEALVYVAASLELADSEQARRMALEALAAGPPATLLLVGPPADDGDVAHRVVFSPDGAWSATVGLSAIRVVSNDGTVQRTLQPLPETVYAISASFDREGRYLLGSRGRGELRLWSVPDFQLLDSRPLPDGGHYPVTTRRGIYLVSDPSDTDDRLVSVTTPTGAPLLVGRLDGRLPYSIDSGGRWLAISRDDGVLARSLQDWAAPTRWLGKFASTVIGVGFAGDSVATELESGELWISSVEERGARIGPFPIRERGRYFFSDDGDRLGVYRSQNDFSVEIWDLRTRSLSPAPLYRFPASVTAGGASAFFTGAAFVPGGRWLATAHGRGVAFWPLRPNEAKVLAENVVSAHGLGFGDLEFTPDGRHLLALVQVGAFGDAAEIWAWDLEEGGRARTLASVSWIQFQQLAVDPTGRFAAVSTWDAIELVPLAGGPVRRLVGYSPGAWIKDLAFDADGRRVAACVLLGPAGDKVIRIWDLQTDEVSVLGPIEGAGDGYEGHTMGVRFLSDGSLVSSGQGGLRLWNVEEGSHTVIAPGKSGSLVALGKSVATVAYPTDTWDGGFVQVTDLETGATRILASRIADLQWIATNRRGTVVASAAYEGDGALQVGSVSGEEPQLLLGHQRGTTAVAVSPDGRWIASAGREGSVRLWPMPDLSKPPLHTLPHDELIAKLKSLTNLRAVRDAESSTGWKIEVGPFPGWAEVPEW